MRGPPRYRPEQHRSGLEDAFRDLCDEEGLKVGYEDSVLSYVSPAQKRRYTPDWTVAEGYYIETKGRFTAADRKKAIAVKEAHPTVRILYVFQRNNTLTRGSKTTYGAWCDKNGIEWCVFKDTKKWQQFIKDYTNDPPKRKRDAVVQRYEDLLAVLPTEGDKDA